MESGKDGVLTLWAALEWRKARTGAGISWQMVVRVADYLDGRSSGREPPGRRVSRVSIAASHDSRVRELCGGDGSAFWEKSGASGFFLG
jgi:hypothetical protein